MAMMAKMMTNIPKAFQGRKNETRNGQCDWLVGMDRAGGKVHVSVLMACDA